MNPEEFGITEAQCTKLATRAVRLGAENMADSRLTGAGDCAMLLETSGIPGPHSWDLLNLARVMARVGEQTIGVRQAYRMTPDEIAAHVETTLKRWERL